MTTICKRLFLAKQFSDSWIDLATFPIILQHLVKFQSAAPNAIQENFWSGPYIWLQEIGKIWKIEEFQNLVQTRGLTSDLKASFLSLSHLPLYSNFKEQNPWFQTSCTQYRNESSLHLLPFPGSAGIVQTLL